MLYVLFSEYKSKRGLISICSTTRSHKHATSLTDVNKRNTQNSLIFKHLYNNNNDFY